MVRRGTHIQIALSCLIGFSSLCLPLSALAQSVPSAEERFCALPLLLGRGEEQQEPGAPGGKQKKTPGKEQDKKEEKDKG